MLWWIKMSYIIPENRKVNGKSYGFDYIKNNVSFHYKHM